METIIEITQPIKNSLLEEQLNSAYAITYLFWLASNGPRTWLTIPDGLDPAIAAGVLAAHNPAAETSDEAGLRQVRELATSAVGVRIQDLTAAQTRALLAVLLYKNGAIDRQALTIRPLKEWAA